MYYATCGSCKNKDLPFRSGETVEVKVRAQKKNKTAKKNPLRAKLIIYHLPFKDVSEDD